MIEFLKKNLLIIILFLITLFVGFFTFLTFIDKGFIELNQSNLQYLLIINIVLIFLLFILVYLEIKKSIKTDIDKDGTKSGPNIKETVSLSNLTKIPFVISGGVSSINDVISIKKNQYQNIEGIIIGKAIYDGNIDIKKLSKII